MRVGVIQSCYVPWRGYFDFIANVDLFVILDDVPYSKGSWRNRNLLKTRNGLKWLTVPVQAAPEKLTIEEVRIGNTRKPWRDTHRNQLRAALGPAPFFEVALSLWEDGVSQNDPYLSSMNVRLTKLICDYLRIGTPIVMARDYGATGVKTERLIRLLQRVGARSYLSGPSAKGYLDESMFRDCGIHLEYKAYEYAQYPQLWGLFEGNVTVLDLIANCGPQARQYLRSCAADYSAIT